MSEKEPTPALALLLASNGSLDDVAVDGVSMFRAEVLDESRLWKACCLNGTGVEGDRICFEVSARGGHLHFE